ncbi:putative F420-dependent oxidoreductase [Catenuloplanes nepalensis]|uniref:F420-dependent oxidoreductase n=1 Tax=Catenuloplanes nepalensis TaxID=587533 RepID=A0ABT9N1Z8_9ACTN|nr:TIGR03619 family F420-dependent LLM class oxidoreductase [Catenuloplanes nepalensis]MDP9797723.1 putative F420-dependent oxidoreductase [Catenuloplanes nepalensis]
MHVGLGLPVAGAWASPDRLAAVATRAEQLGYHSLWTFQRLFVPVDPQPEPVYRSVLDPLIALAFAAARTTTIRLGVAIVNLPFVPPVHLAKQAATLDVLSGGRLDLGLGSGWSAPEFVAAGADLARRGPRTAEYVRVLRTLWSGSGAPHEGEFYRLPAGYQHPLPVQRPGPPILLGGSAPAALRRAGRLADGWISRSKANLAEIGDSVALVRAAAAEAGRDPDAIRVVSRGPVRAGGALPEAGRKPLTGSYAQIRADVNRLAEAGVTEVFHDLNWDPAIGAPDADPEAASRRADEIIEALAP